METKKNKSLISITYNAPVILTFALVSFIALIIANLTQNRSNVLLFEVYRSRLSVFWFLRLFLHPLGHANFTHFTSNMTLFLLIGPVLEEKYGSANLLEMFVITAVISGLVMVVFFPGTALLGASGIVFMMIILMSSSGLGNGKIPLTMILVVVIYLGAEIYKAITAKDDISQLSHIIGGICGAVFGFIYERGGLRKK